jgi:hypothetical protein
MGRQRIDFDPEIPEFLCEGRQRGDPLGKLQAVVLQ